MGAVPSSTPLVSACLIFDELFMVLTLVGTLFSRRCMARTVIVMRHISTVQLMGSTGEFVANHGMDTDPTVRV